MIKKLLAGTFTYILVLGVLAVAIYKTTGINMSYIAHVDYGIGMYTFNFSDYLKGLRDTIDQIMGVKLLQLPPTVNLQWNDIFNSLKSVGNLFVIGINYILFTFNILFAVIKIAFYIALIVSAIMGINNTDLNILVFANYFYKLNIPYITPIGY